MVGVVVVQLLSRVLLCNPMNCSMPSPSVLHYLLEFAQIHVHWVSDAIQSSHLLPPPSLFAFALSQHRVFPVSRLSSSGGQRIGASASASVLPMNIQGCVSFRGDKSVLNLDSVIAAQLCKSAKNHWIVFFKMANFIVYEYFILP